MDFIQSFAGAVLPDGCQGKFKLLLLHSSYYEREADRRAVEYWHHSITRFKYLRMDYLSDQA